VLLCRMAIYRRKVIGSEIVAGKQIEQYDHKGKTRVNNPPVGLVTPDTDKDAAKKNYAYDPHLDPALQFDKEDFR